ncbi:MAG: zinc transporter ZupT [Alphaproteobacteria bacterium]|nr:zinc transporter ZupT [Alphaproteobacteria bacterium]
MEAVFIAFIMTLFAGLATGIGSCIAFFARKKNAGFLSVCLGFSAGVMLYISFMDMLPEAKNRLISVYGNFWGNMMMLSAFFAGIMLIAVIDALVPSYENPHALYRDQKEINQLKHRSKKLFRLGLMTALVVTIHNFPEGLTTFMVALENPILGLPITIAIALHNIPEGIAISVPIYYATRSRKKAFRLSFLSGLSEPLGAVIGYLILRPFITPALMGAIFAFVSGIMVYISVDELLPAARAFGKPHLSVMGLIIGMVIIAFSLVLLNVAF